MPQPIGRDLDETRAKLVEWLAKKLPQAERLRIEGLRGPRDTGFSSDTLMFDLHYDQNGSAVREDLVIRLEPAGAFGIFPEYDVALQHDMMKALADTPVPVPRMLWLEEDRGALGAPFYVMERLEGRVPNDSPPYHSEGWIFDLAPGKRAELWYSGLEAMAEVHKLDWERPEFSFLQRPAPGTTPLQAQLQYWDDYIGWGMERSRYPLCAEALAWLRSHQPADEPTAICWGDARISNQIFADCRTIAVIDWEMVFLGNPVADLAWFITMDRCFTEGLGVERLAGMPDRRTTIDRWEECLGRRAEHVQYYEYFAAFRFALIMARVFLQMKHYELLPREAVVDVENMATGVLRTVMAEAGA